MRETRRWYVIWRCKGETGYGAAWGTDGPHDSLAEAIPKMREMMPDEPDCEFAVADVCFPSDIKQEQGK